MSNEVASVVGVAIVALPDESHRIDVLFHDLLVGERAVAFAVEAAFAGKGEIDRICVIVVAGVNARGAFIGWANGIA